MAIINLEIEDSLYQDIQKQGIDLQSKIKEFLESLKDDRYPGISTDEATQRVHDAIADYQQNGMKNCKVVDDTFWDDTENRLLKRHKKVS